MSIKAASSFSLKDHLFNAGSLAKLSARFHAALPAFPRQRFERTVLARFPQLELKQRIDWIVTALEAHLPAAFPLALEVLHRALPEPLEPSRTDDDFGDYIWVVPGEYVARHGCSVEHLQPSLAFLREATKRFTAESAIRPFLRAFPRETLAFVHTCAEDPNYHVRRLASEGIRPFLPWAPRVELPLGEVIAVLERLHADPTRYVTRSVANTLNDVSKIDADLTIRTLQNWHRQQRQRPAELDWMTRHALRTLVKQDHVQALELLGISTEPQFRLGQVRTTAAVKVGGDFEWRCSVRSLISQRLKIALRIHFLKANGRLAPKVFSVMDVTLVKDQRVEIRKRLPLRPATTRTLYPGTHFAELVVNGVTRQRKAFELVV
jgi:3-methyladenine DNA glycosylase AlkC